MFLLGDGLAFYSGVKKGEGGLSYQVCPAFYSAGVGAYVVGADVGAGTICVGARAACIIPVCTCGARSSVKSFCGRCEG